jgi:crotonobetainyl-CoA:carnitine CoA-transferase CaiB-like acyl-CoA transferase
MAAEPTGPLKGMKIVEVAQVVAGPTCGYMLADLGAEVIKVERIPNGDDNRRMVPPAIAGEAAAFLMLNRNKRGIALDLKAPAGREVLFRLADRADAMIENYRKGVMDRLGVGYEALKRRNPGLIYCAISGFGQTGPYAERGGYDLVAQAMSGLMSITGEGPGRPPVKVGSPLTDFGAGVLAALGIAAAYAHKLTTGEGQLVDTSLFEAGISATFHQTAMYLATGESPGPLGSAHPLSAPYQAYPTKDGWITVGAGNQSNWPRLCAALGAPELVEDGRFKLNGGRLANLDQLNAALEPLFRRFTTAELMEKLEDAGVPAGPVNTIGQMAADPQALARGMIAEVPHAKAGRVKTLGSPIKFGATPTNLRRGAPVFGEHTREVLAEVGYGKDEIERLIAEKVVIAA